MRSPTARDAAEGLASRVDFIERTVALARQNGLNKVVLTGTPESWDAVIAALRSAGTKDEETQGATEMREACLHLCGSARYGAPSTWPGAHPRGWKPPLSWDPGRVPTPEEAALHDNGVTDAWIAILTGTRDEQGNPRVPRTTLERLRSEMIRLNGYAGETLP